MRDPRMALKVMNHLRARRLDAEEQERDERGRFGSGGGGGGSKDLESTGGIDTDKEAAAIKGSKNPEAAAEDKYTEIMIEEDSGSIDSDQAVKAVESIGKKVGFDKKTQLRISNNAYSRMQDRDD